MDDFRTFAADHLARIEALWREVNLAYWTATISGPSRDFERYATLEVELQTVYTDREDFRRLSRWPSASAIAASSSAPSSHGD
jgi:hypothetical protein